MKQVELCMPDLRSIKEPQETLPSLQWVNIFNTTNIMDHVQIINREEHFWNRKIREAIKIKSQKPSLNRDTGYELAPIYDDLLTPERACGQVFRGR